MFSIFLSIVIKKIFKKLQAAAEFLQSFYFKY